MRTMQKNRLAKSDTASSCQSFAYWFTDELGWLLATLATIAFPIAVSKTATAAYPDDAYQRVAMLWVATSCAFVVTLFIHCMMSDKLKIWELREIAYFEVTGQQSPMSKLTFRTFLWYFVIVLVSLAISETINYKYPQDGGSQSLTAWIIFLVSAALSVLFYAIIQRTIFMYTAISENSSDGRTRTSISTAELRQQNPQQARQSREMAARTRIQQRIEDRFQQLLLEQQQVKSKLTSASSSEEDEHEGPTSD